MSTSSGPSSAGRHASQSGLQSVRRVFLDWGVGLPAGAYTLTVLGSRHRGSAFRLSDLTTGTLLTPNTSVTDNPSPATAPSCTNSPPAGDRYSTLLPGRGSGPRARRGSCDPRQYSCSTRGSHNAGPDAGGDRDVFLLVEGGSGSGRDIHVHRAVPGNVRRRSRDAADPGKHCQQRLTTAGQLNRYIVHLAGDAQLYFDSFHPTFNGL